MAKHPIQNRVMGRDADLETPSSSPQYPLGYQVQVIDNNSDTTKNFVQVLEYVQAGAALEQYGVYTIVQSATSAAVATVNTSALTAPGYCRVCVPQTAVTSGYYCFVPVKGVVTCAATAAAGVNLTGGQMLRVLNAATTATVETVSNSTATAADITRKVDNIGYVTGFSVTSANSISVYLFGDPVIRNYSALL